MLHEFLTSNREKLIAQCHALAVTRAPVRSISKEIKHGVPIFIDQLIDTLRVEQNALHDETAQKDSVPTEKQQPTEMSKTATKHGRELLERGYTIDQVVHAYGDVCQAVTELASEGDTQIDAEEFKTFNGCLDNAIAAAVTEFDRKREEIVWKSGNTVVNERLLFLAQEVRNSVGSAMLAVAVIKRGAVGTSGATAGVLDRSLTSIRDFCDEALSEARPH